MPTLTDTVRERMVARDEVDGIQLDMPKIEGYLKRLVLWIRILIMTVLVISFVSIGVLNFFAPASKDVSERVILKLLNAVNSQNIDGLVAEVDSGRTSRTAKWNNPRLKSRRMKPRWIRQVRTYTTTRMIMGPM